MTRSSREAMPRPAILLGALAMVWMTALVSCGENRAGTGPDSDAAGDVTRQDAEADAASDAQDDGDGLTCNVMNCPGVCCGNACQVPAVAASCASCSQSILYCNATGIGLGDCRADCATCAAGPIQCFSCGTPGSPPVGTCSMTAADCGGASVPCPCASGKATDCPGTEQVCVQNQCLTCGGVGTDGQKCKNGKACGASASQCQ